ncbi:MAG: DUF2793 domain-containing protein [Pseudomonadota bacterium]
MSSTANLDLPYIAPAQAQKHVTHNEALRKLDTLVQLTLASRGVLEIPQDPADPTCYAVPTNAVGAWADRAGEVACFTDGAWTYVMPRAGWRAWVEDEAVLVVWNGSTWSEVSAGTGSGTGSVNPAALVGVNTEAALPNRLAVKSDAVLFSHDDVTPGSGDVRHVLNKSSAADTASHLYQSGFSGRAELGLTGDDHFHLKVSDDGAAWSDAIVVDPASAAVALPASGYAQNIAYNLLPDGGRFSGSPEPAGIIASSFAAPSYLTPYNGATISSFGKNTYDSASYGGAGATQPAEMVELLTRFTSSDFFRRYALEFHVLEVTAGSGTAYSYSIGGENFYLTFTNSAAPRWVRSTWSMQLRVQTGGLYIAPPVGVSLYVDGVPAGGGVELAPSDGWRQIIYIGEGDAASYAGFDDVMWRVCATPGTVYLAALPYLFPGQLPIHAGAVTGHVPTLRTWGG